MSFRRNFGLRMAAILVVCVPAGCGLCMGQAKAGVAADQPASTLARPTEEQFTSALAEVKRGNWAEVDLVAAAGAVRATPILKEIFASSEGADMKSTIARAMIDLGNKDDAYPDYLIEQGKLAAESDIPFPMNGDGKQPSAELTAWANVHHVTPETAARESLYDLPGRVLMLGSVQDRRAVAVLRRALQAPDVMIRVAGAEGLAWLQDKDSIPLILDACSKAPAEMASTIALFSLVYFDDPRAQGGAAQYLSREMLQAFEGGKLYRPVSKRVTPQP